MNWFTNSVGLFAFAALPAVLILHLYRQRHRDYPVSAMFLWLDPESRDSSGFTRRPLQKNPSFWLEMLAALLLALCLSGFQPWGASKVVHLVVVLDDSASMSATPNAPALSPRDATIAYLEEQFQKLGRRTRVTLIQSGLRPQLLCGPGALLAEAREALAAWQPQSSGHDPRSALQFAREFSAGEEVQYFTDHAPTQESAVGAEVRVIALGLALENAAILGARRFRPEGVARDHVSFSVRSFAWNDQERLIRIMINQQVVTEKSFRLRAGTSVDFDFPLPASVGAVDLQLDPDGLLLDNQIRLFPNPDRIVKVSIGLEEEAVQALRLQQLIQALPHANATQEQEQANLFVGHARAPSPAWSLVLPRNPNDTEQAEAFIAGFLPEKRHALMQGLTLQGVVWTRAREFLLDGIPLLSIGDIPLLTERAQDGTATFHLNLLPQRSTLPQSPDWPILMSNLVELCRSSLEGPRTRNLVAGQAFEYVHQGRKDFVLVGANDERTLHSEKLLEVEDLPPFNDYILLDGEAELTRFTVNFADPQESDLSAAESQVFAPLAGTTVLAQQAYAESPIGRILLLLLLACLAGDWLYLGKEKAQ
ncbi:MAG: hypothetical protein COA70_02570 [Planctomycetota bacterium]|nr:MAG: hypothetical protein COA70_02570 [Planctomycetota bacterium]